MRVTYLPGKTGLSSSVQVTSGTYAAGQALVRQGSCEGRWDIDLVLVDPELVPPRRARQARPRRAPEPGPPPPPLPPIRSVA